MARPTQRRELFATEEDISTAAEIVGERLGEDFEVDYTSVPKNVGVMGDEGVLGHSVLLIPVNGSFKEIYDKEDGPEVFDAVMREIIGNTQGASRVLIDITADLPPGLPFIEIEPVEE